MPSVVSIALFAFGHLVRDGWPPFKETLLRWGAPAWVVSLSTHFARITGAAICGLGVALIADDPIRAVLWIGGAILAGFYADMKHGEGQQANSWSCVPYLMLSGATSLAPLGVVWWINGGGWEWFILICLSGGVVKPLIWFAATGAVSVQPGKWLSPTRAAAMGFGGVIGAFLVLT